LKTISFVWFGIAEAKKAMTVHFVQFGRVDAKNR